ncbi:MAG TPA: CRTAC1 family protein [Alloacidobacterium sp.]|nr:CRTAC1 family protein [Alloacidobacterium sp.]HYK37764.1 CRTAC1 family protein [Alloacidobacterium sp.]
MSSQQGGASTGGVYAPVHDAEHRPITAGGFVERGPVAFKDVSVVSGLAAWRNEGGTPAKAYIVESLGNGVALLDYDNDGWLDIYLVNGMTYDAMSGKAPAPHAALFHNNHDGTFTNVAAQAGVTNDRWGVGVAVGDYDNDGWPDLYVTNVGKNRLYHNNHDGTFNDMAEKAGVALGTWSTGPTFGDYDGDGRLDLFVPGYTQYDFANPPAVGSNSVVSNNCKYRGVSVFCGPRGLRGEHDHLFRNNGDGTFTDVSAKAGVADAPGYYGLVSLFVDLNDDGRPDLLVADDSTPNYLYRNKGDGTFEDLSFESGYAVNRDGRETASMGIAVGDYQNNGRLDILNTTFSDDYKVLYQNNGDLDFTDVSYDAGIATPTIPFLSWGDGFIDYDNDGWKDIFIASGHVYPQVDQHDWGTSMAERPLLFRNIHGQKFELVPPVKGTGLADVILARGAAFGDLFNDGKIDVVINNLDAPPTLLRNVSEDRHHWVEFKLIGGAKSPHDAIGAVVFLSAGSMKQRGDVLSGGSFASSNDPRVHFGLGDAMTVDSVEIRWPSGVREKISVPNVDRIYTVEEGKGVTASFCARCTVGKEAAVK